jgi:predicted dehydrogenase
MLAWEAMPWPGGIDRPHIELLDGRPLPQHEMRVRPRFTGWPRGDVIAVGSPIPGLPLDGSLATFHQGITEHGLVARTARGSLVVALSEDSPAWHEPRFLELLAVASRATASPSRDYVVGLLGYGAIGAEHARAVRETAGLALGAVCDLNPSRMAAALVEQPGLIQHADPSDLLADEHLDIVVISTPPDSHARWAHEALDRGLHVVVEKPMALTAQECDALMEHARRAQRQLVVYQNRRFDPDYMAIRRLARGGALGEIFHLESFIGGYAHPCNYWHSDAEVSGGALFDWGSHIVDQILDLIDGEVEYVTAVNHKRVWHDVTNADHARMSLYFDGGREATFVFSDLAAALKPRWYVLGTQGAVTSEWRVKSVVTRNAIGTLDEDVLAPADAPPEIRLHLADGSVTTLAYPAREPHPFHADLSLSLHFGVDPRVQGFQSRRVIAMLQAAEESASLGGIPVKPS